MKIEPVNCDDLEEIRTLQPEGWSDIVQKYSYYIDKQFCHPGKIILDAKIVGVGSVIIMDRTCWLAHIIVAKYYRKRGIGSVIVNELLNIAYLHSVETFLLIATQLGMPVYEKTGFNVVSKYNFYKRYIQWNEDPNVSNTFEYNDEYYEPIMELDREVSGEDREAILKEYLNNSFLKTIILLRDTIFLILEKALFMRI